MDIAKFALTIALVNETDNEIYLVELGISLAPAETYVVESTRVPDILICARECTDTELYKAVQAGKITISFAVPNE